MENPNPYDDGLFTKRSMDVSDAIGAMWEAGASIDDIANDVANGIENAEGGGPVNCTITERS